MQLLLSRSEMLSFSAILDEMLEAWQINTLHDYLSTSTARQVLDDVLRKQLQVSAVYKVNLSFPQATAILIHFQCITVYGDFERSLINRIITETKNHIYDRS